MIHHRQGLGGHRAAISLGDRETRIGSIEFADQGWEGISKPRQIDRTQVGLMLVAIILFGPWANGRAHRTPDLQLPAGLEHGISERLAIQSPQESPCENLILRILFKRIGTSRNASAVGLGGSDRLDEPFGGPILGDEFRSEPVQELRIRGGQTGCTKVIHGRNDPPAHHVVPNPVDIDSGRQWIFRSDRPLGEFQSAVVGGLDADSTIQFRLMGIDAREKTSLNDRPQAMDRASHMDGDIRGRIGRPEGLCHGAQVQFLLDFRLEFLKNGDLLDHRLVLLVDIFGGGLRLGLRLLLG